MDGNEHFREAERLIAQAESEWPRSTEGDPYPRAAFLIAQAQVHATLAHSAATLQTTAQFGAWHECNDDTPPF